MSNPFEDPDDGLAERLHKESKQRKKSVLLSRKRSVGWSATKWVAVMAAVGCVVIMMLSVYA